MILYLEDKDLDGIFALVAERYGRQEEVPAYRDSREGIAELLGVLERAKMDAFYPTLLDKATHLLLGINKGHFFSNGNKRLALAVTTTFLTLNRHQLAEPRKEVYKTRLAELFPEHSQCTDFPEFTATDFATYNLSIIIADSGTYHLDYELLKERVHAFLAQSLEEAS
jgi:prophage maintenance system killer protein